MLADRIRLAGSHLHCENALHVVGHRNHSWRIRTAGRVADSRADVTAWISAVLHSCRRLVHVVDGTIHGACHEELLEGGDARLHGRIFILETRIPLLQVPDILCRLA